MSRNSNLVREQWTKPCPNPGCENRCGRASAMCFACRAWIRRETVAKRRRQSACSCGTCRRCRQSKASRAAWARGAFARRDRNRSPAWDEWSIAERNRLAGLAGTMAIEAIADALAAEFHVRRTPQAIRIKATRWGISLWRQGLSMGDVERIFRYDHRAIVTRWIQSGLLRGERIRGRGPHAGWLFQPTDVEQFIREHVWAYDWRHMAPGRWRSLAEISSRADPWCSVDELRRYLGYQSEQFWSTRWRDIPHRRRYHAKTSTGGTPVIRAADFPAIAELLAGIKHANVQAAQRAAVAKRPQNQPGWRPRRTTWKRTCQRCGAKEIGRAHEPIPERCWHCGAVAADLRLPTVELAA